MDTTASEGTFAKKFDLSESHVKLFGAILILALVAGITTGYFLSASNSPAANNLIPLTQDAKVAQKQSTACRDFAEGKITKKPDPKAGDDYTEGTHLLVRQNAVPVALTSSSVDLSTYEGKNVKVCGETQKALKEGWLMDVGRVDEK